MMFGKSGLAEHLKRDKSLTSCFNSRFGLAFQSAAEDSGAGSRHDMFDTSLVEIRKDDLTTFVEHLQLESATR